MDKVVIIISYTYLQKGALFEKNKRKKKIKKSKRIKFWEMFTVFSSPKKITYSDIHTYLHMYVIKMIN